MNAKRFLLDEPQFEVISGGDVPSDELLECLADLLLTMVDTDEQGDDQDGDGN